MKVEGEDGLKEDTKRRQREAARCLHFALEIWKLLNYLRIITWKRKKYLEIWKLEVKFPKFRIGITQNLK